MTADGVQEKAAYLASRMQVKSTIGYFMRFFPLEYAAQGLGASQLEYDLKYSDIHVKFEQAHLVRFIGVLFKMTMLHLANRDHYWRVSEYDGVDVGISKFTSKNVFKRTLECLQLPKD